MPPSRGLGLAIVVVAALLGAGAAPSGDGPPLPVPSGGSLQAALRALQARGVRVVFSTALVPADLRVSKPPTAADPREALAEILAPHGLTVEPGRGGRWLVVRSHAAGAATLALGVTPSEVAAYVAVESITVRTAGQVLTDPRTGARTLDRAALLDAHGAFTGFGDALALLPGTATADSSAELHLRGADAFDLRVVVDDLELEEPLRWWGLHGLLGAVDPQTVGRVDVLAGGYPAEYGGGLGGLLNVTSVTPGRPRTEVGLDTRGTRFFGEGRMGPRANWLLAARHGDLAARTDFDGSTYHGLEPQYFDAFGKLERPLRRGGSLRLAALWNADRSRLRVDGFKLGNGTFDRVEIGSVRSREDQGYVWLRLEVPWRKGLDGRTMLGVGNGRREREVWMAPTGHFFGPEHLRDERRFALAELKQDWLYAGLGRHTLGWGLRSRRVFTDYDRDPTRIGPTGDPLTSRELHLDRTGTLYEGYLSDRLDLGRGRSVEAGVRWDRSAWPESGWSPRLNVVWPLGSGWARLGAGRIRQPPRLTAVRVEDGRTAIHPPQVADQLVLGYERTWGRTFVELAAYRHDGRRVWSRFVMAEGPTDSVPEAVDVGSRVRVRLDSTRTQGFELLAQRQFGPRVQGQLSYTFAKATDHVMEQVLLRQGLTARDGEVPPRWDQRHAVDAALSWRPGNAWRVDLAGFYWSGWPRTDFGATTFVDSEGRRHLDTWVGSLNGRRFGVSHRLDLRVTRSVALGEGELELELAVTNLYDRHNACCTEHTELQLLPEGGLSTRRNDLTWLPRRVSLGATWSF